MGGGEGRKRGKRREAKAAKETQQLGLRSRQVKLKGEGRKQPFGFAKKEFRNAHKSMDFGNS